MLIGRTQQRTLLPYGRSKLNFYWSKKLYFFSEIFPWWGRHAAAETTLLGKNQKDFSVCSLSLGICERGFANKFPFVFITLSLPIAVENCRRSLLSRLLSLALYLLIRSASIHHTPLSHFTAATYHPRSSRRGENELTFPLMLHHTHRLVSCVAWNWINTQFSLNTFTFTFTSLHLALISRM